MDIFKVTKQDIGAWIYLAMRLWPDEDPQDFTREFDKYSSSDNAISFISKNEKGKVIALIALTTRKEFVEGAYVYPVGYVEGLYVQEDYRNMGIAKKLISAATRWAKSKGCRQLASDAELVNEESQAFHKKEEFEETNRLVCYIKHI